ncbi:MAG: ferrochelatase [Chitinophagales bacterium]
MAAKKGLLLVNLGTPDSPAVPDVRKYLKEFLLDARVIDIPALPRNILVRGIIAPFRAPKSAAVYAQIWTDEGSPLLVYSKRLLDKVKQRMGSEWQVELAMRYQKPSIASALSSLKENKVEEITILPLFPQYASATNGSVLEKVMELLTTWENIPHIHTVGAFYDHPLFIRACADAASAFDILDWDHVLFSYHGLPERQIHKAAEGNSCLQKGCCDTIHVGNRNCYRAQCFATSRLLAEALHIPAEKYTVCFQSRLGKTPWIRPYANETIAELAQSGKKRLLVFSPAFVADCLETLYEIAVEYDQECKHAGGEKIQLVPAVNDSDVFVSCIEELVARN